MKKELLEHCKQLLHEKLTTIKLSIKELQASANEDSKSSMGDKYETGRAMVHMEQENLMSRYSDLQNQYELINQISPKETKVVTQGSLVKTNNGNFYISIGLGKVEYDNQVIFSITMGSPIGQKLINKTVGDQFELNGRSYSIIEVR